MVGANFSKTAVVLAGEKSGDLIASEVISKLCNNGFEVFGVGGEQSLKSGLRRSFFDIAEISIMGFLEIVPKIFHFKKLISQTIENIITLNPEFVITVDSPGFNTRVVKGLREAGYKGKLFHCVAPTVWAYKPKRALKFAKLFDKLFCILPFEPPYFERVGLPAVYICYPPLFRILPEIEQAAQAKPKEYFIFTLGSRRNEIRYHMEFAKQTVALIKHQIPEAKFAFPTFKEFEEEIKRNFPGEITVTEEAAKQNVLRHAKFAISKSGTGAVEYSFLGIPSVMYYKANQLSYLIIKFLAIIKFANLINVLLNREVIPEFIQNNATPENISKKVLEMLSSKNLLKAQEEGVLQAKNMLLNAPYNNFGHGVVSEILKDQKR